MTKLKSACQCRCSGEQGSALLVALLSASIVTGLGLALAGLGRVETVIAVNHRMASQLVLAADGGVEAALAELPAVSDWSDVLGGVVSSRLAGHRVPPVAPGEAPLTLGQLTAAMQLAYGRMGSWGANTPQWRMFGHGWLAEIVPAAAADSDEFLATFVADDVGESDGNPQVDTNGRIQVAARASNRRGAQRTLIVLAEKSVGPSGTPGVRVLTWKEMQ